MDYLLSDVAVLNPAKFGVKAWGGNLQARPDEQRETGLDITCFATQLLQVCDYLSPMWDMSQLLLSERHSARCPTKSLNYLRLSPPDIDPQIRRAELISYSSPSAPTTVPDRPGGESVGDYAAVFRAPLARREAA